MLNLPPYAKPTAVPGHSATCGCVHCFQAAHAAARDLDHALTVKCLKGTVTKADMAATSKAWSDLWARGVSHGERYTAAQLRSMPTLATGQADDLKIERAHTRVWLSRCTVEDGEPYNNKITVERQGALGVWEVRDVYQG